jgi:DNA polymerase-3 subunit beta
VKITAERKALAESAAWVSQAAERKPQVPALAGMRLTASEGRLTLQSYNFEVSHAAVLPAEVATPGEVLVPAAFLREILSGFKTATVELSLDGARLVMTAGRARYACSTLVLDDFPTLPAMPSTVGHIDADALAESVAATTWAIDASPASTTTAALAAVHVTSEGDTLTMAATDRFVVAEAVTTFAGAGAGAFVANVPGAGLSAAVKGLSGNVTIGAEGGLFGLADEGRAVTMRCLDVEYPNLRRLLRAEDPVTVTVDAEDLAAAVKRAGVLAEREGILDIEATDGLSVSVPASEEGDGDEHLDAEVVGGPVRGSLAPGKLTAALAAVGSGPVTLGFEPNEAGSFGGKLVYLRSKRAGLTVAVMPKRAGR